MRERRTCSGAARTRTRLFARRVRRADRLGSFGRPWEELKPYLTLAAGEGDAKRGERVVELVAVASAKTPVAGPGRGHKAEDKTVGNDCPSFTDSRKNKNLRAILRAPEPIQAAYRDGLIGRSAPSPSRSARDRASRTPPKWMLSRRLGKVSRPSLSAARLA